MLIHIAGVLSPAEVQEAREALLTAQWADGRATAGAQSAQVKHNDQLARENPVAQEWGDRILDALGASPLFVSAALPHRTVPPLFNRYSPGQHFGTHIDNAIRPVGGVKIRTDLSATLFLSDPESYDGGELVVETPFGAQAVKLPAGDLVLYPASSLHRVEAISRGSRLASFFWVQSMIRDDGARAILFDLDQSIQRLSALVGVDNAEVIALTGLYHNLVRRWAET